MRRLWCPSWRATRAGVDRADHQRPRREGGAAPGAADAHPTRLEGLAHALEDVAPELEQLVEEEHPVVGEAHLAGADGIASAEERGRAEGVVGGAERAAADQAVLAVEQARHRVDGGDGEALLVRHRGQDGG